MHEPVLKIEWKFYTFIARNCKKVKDQHLDAGEKIKVKKISFDDFLKIVDSEKFRNKYFANELFRMKFENKLDDFKKKLFKN